MDETCNPQACPAAALSALPNMSLWQWFGEILAMESTGLDITSLAFAWPITVLRAFTALRAAILAIEKRKAEAEIRER